MANCLGKQGNLSQDFSLEPTESDKISGMCHLYWPYIGQEGDHTMSHLSLVGNAHRSSESPRTTRLQLRSWRRFILLALIAFVLGRASILHVISPFGFAFFVILNERGGRATRTAGYAAALGAWMVGGLPTALLMLLQFVLYRLARRYVLKQKTVNYRFIPLLAGSVALLSNLLVIGTVWTKMDLMLALADAALVTLLGLIFIQCIGLFLAPESSKELRSEQVVSLVILAGSFVMGLSQWTVHGVSVATVAVDWMVLMLACGGMGIAVAAAILLSLLSMLSHNGTLADAAVCGFGGFLAGLMKETNRFWMGVSFFLSVVVLSMATSPDWHGLFATAGAALAAFTLYLLTPGSLREEFASFIPGTAENRQSERDRVRRMNQLMTEKIEQFGQVFEELAVTFADTGENAFASAQQLVTHMVSTSANQVCRGCARRAVCWDKQGMQTYQAMANTISQMEVSPRGKALPTADLKERCCRLDSMMGVLRYNLDLTYRDEKWMKKLYEQRTLVASQLGGVAAVVRAISAQIQTSDRIALSEEEQILAGFEELGLYVDRIHIVSLESGKIEIEISLPAAGGEETATRMVAPLLSGILNETVSLARMDAKDHDLVRCTFASARRYTVQTAVAGAARGGRLVSGDTHTTVDLGNGRYALAVSDGMGNGERARRESKAAIELAKKLLRAGFDEHLTIQTINSALLLRNQDEMFTTLDLALIDLFSARADFLKVGCAPSFILRGQEVLSITGDGVPIGILQNIEVQTVTEQLQAGDILVLLSDGVYDAPRAHYDRTDWLQRQLEQLDTRDLQSIADTLVEAAVRVNLGEISDDMTVVVAKVQPYEPEWASIKLPRVEGLRRKKIVGRSTAGA